MTTKELAIKSGVALPETSIKLEWQGETNFYWVGLHSGNEKDLQYYLAYPYTDEYGVDFLIIKERIYTKRIKSDLTFVYPAPQMHEIAPLLPERILNYQGYETLGLWHTDTRIGYGVINRFFCTEIEKPHFAQAYAELYLQLKQENLIK